MNRKTPLVIHLLDQAKGRESQRKLWTLCGEKVQTRQVHPYDPPEANYPPRPLTPATCKLCILIEALEFARYEAEDCAGDCGGLPIDTQRIDLVLDSVRGKRRT